MAGATETFAATATGDRESDVFRAVGKVVTGVVTGATVTGASDEFESKSDGSGARGGMSAAMVVDIIKTITRTTRHRSHVHTAATFETFRSLVLSNIFLLWCLYAVFRGQVIKRRTERD